MNEKEQAYYYVAIIGIHGPQFFKRVAEAEDYLQRMLDNGHGGEIHVYKLEELRTTIKQEYSVTVER